MSEEKKYRVWAKDSMNKFEFKEDVSLSEAIMWAEQKIKKTGMVEC